MSDTRQERIERCRRLIAECRAKVGGLSPEQRWTVLNEIDPCEQLVSLTQGLVKRHTLSLASPMFWPSRNCEERSCEAHQSGGFGFLQTAYVGYRTDAKMTGEMTGEVIGWQDILNPLSIRSRRGQRA
jgi:hypothetical protein